MSRADRRLLRYIEALLNERRPRRGAAGDDLRAMQLAARLHASHRGAAEPAPEFVDGLARRLRQSQSEAAPTTVPMPQRRSFLAAAGFAAAAGIGAGFGIDRLTAGSRTQQARIAPSEPEWVAVARVSDLRLGRIQRFSANGIEGFVLNSGGRITALS